MVKGIFGKLSLEEERRVMTSLVDDIGDAQANMFLPTVAFDIPSIKKRLLSARAKLERLI